MSNDFVDIPWKTLSQMSSQELLIAMGESGPGKNIMSQLLADGWVYRDFPFRVTHKVWNEFLEILGKPEDDYYILCSSEDINNDWIRGQFLVSPQAMERLEEFRDSKKKL